MMPLMPGAWCCAAVLALVLPLAAPAAAELDEDRHCLALSLYWEARDEGREGMLAVAAVIRNRMRSPDFPATACAVVFEGGETPPCQFAWWCDGKSDEPTEPELWALAQKVAAEPLPAADPTGGALFFKSIDDPDWVKDRQRTVRIGNHVYYK